MVYCKECAKQISDKATFCRYCGARQRDQGQKPVMYADITDDIKLATRITFELLGLTQKIAFDTNKTQDYRLDILMQQIDDLRKLYEGDDTDVTEVNYNKLFERIQNDKKEIEKIIDDYQSVFEAADYLFKKYGFENVDFKLLKHNSFYVDDLQEELKTSDKFDEIVEKYEGRIERYREQLLDYTNIINDRLDEVCDKIDNS
jgi:hypothetical protein